MFKSIRHGLFAALAGFTVLICVCYTGLALVVAYVTEDMLIDRLMAREAAAIAAQVRVAGADRVGSTNHAGGANRVGSTPGADRVGASDGVGGTAPAPPAGNWIRTYRDATALPPAVRAQVVAGRERAEVFGAGGRHYHLRTLDLATPSGAQRVYLVADAGPLLVVSQLVRDVGGVLLAVALGLTGLALLLAWLLSRRLVAPLLALAEAVRRFKPGDAGGGAGANASTGAGAIAFDARNRRDEIGYLADRLGSTLSELHAALAREQAFTCDVGHELRTPLTVMRNTLALAPSAALGPDAAAQLRSQVDEIGGTVDVLFALARAGHVARESFDLRACIEDALLRLVDAGALDPERLTLDVPERLPVSGNRHLATLLVNNCLGNALFHGGPGTRLQLAFANGVLGIVNSIDPERTGTTQGFLHGQNLLRRAAAAMGWELRFDAAAAHYRVDIVPSLPE